MTDGKSKASLPDIEEHIFMLRGQRVMLGNDLAELYGVETRILMQAVRRNLDHFPEDFMLHLTWEEVERADAEFSTGIPSQISRSQFVILKRGRNVKYRPYAFTEQGVAMLSSVLRSKRAVRVNIEIMRTFVRLRKILTEHKELARKLSELEAKYDAQFKVVFDAIRELMSPAEHPRSKIGFKPKPK